MKISVCSDIIFNRKPTAEAMKDIKAAGADALEFWSADGKDLAAIAAASRDLDLPVAAFCAPVDDPPISPRGPESLPEKLRLAGEACEALGCRTLIVASGRPENGWAPAEMHDRLIASLEACLPVAEEMDFTLLLEPINASERSYLRSSREGFDICRMLNSPRLMLLYDLYHMQYGEGNLINTIRANASMIGHVHAADLPGRRAPGSGEINFPRVLEALSDAGCDCHVGLEYRPGEDAAGELAATVALLKGGN